MIDERGSTARFPCAHRKEKIYHCFAWLVKLYSVCSQLTFQVRYMSNCNYDFNNSNIVMCERISYTYLSCFLFKEFGSLLSQVQCACIF
jgi:hypothetical protein